MKKIITWIKKYYPTIRDLVVAILAAIETTKQLNQ